MLHNIDYLISFLIVNIKKKFKRSLYNANDENFVEDVDEEIVFDKVIYFCIYFTIKLF